MAPANGPYISGTTISTVAVNARFSDIENEITDSASRSGKGGFTAPVRTADGTVAAPSHSFTSSPSDGLYRVGANALGVAIGGVDALRLAPGAIGIGAPPNANANVTISVANQPVIDFVSTGGGAGNKIARLVYDSGAAFGVPSFVFQNLSDAGAFVANGLVIRRDGLLQLGVQAAPIQPATLWTAITPNALWTAGSGLAYWKDALGMVHMKGTLSPAGGFGSAFTFPVGFRPTSVRAISMFQSGTPVAGFVNPDGSIASTGFLAGNLYFMDAVSFLAEQ